MISNQILNSIINDYCAFDEVEAIGIAGSSASNNNDNSSDIDIYIFIDNEISIEKREIIVKKYSSNYEIGCQYFGSGDEYFADKLNKQLDIMYFNKNWLMDIFNSIWLNYTPSNGYTTAFLYTLNILDVLYSKTNWIYNLKNKLDNAYPEKLRENIIKRNMMLLYDKPFASYYNQIEKAIKRNDIISINHRISAFLASYFDIIFALNYKLHPGEKRLIEYAKNNCKILPLDFEKNINDLLTLPYQLKLEVIEKIVENLKKLPAK